MGLRAYQIFVDDSSERLITGRNTFSRSLGGALIIPGGTLFPTASFARELFWNTLSGALFVRNEANTEWISVSGADPNASYVTMGGTGSLPNERVLSGGLGTRVTDGGTTAIVSVNDAVVAMVSGTTFTGPVVAPAGLSGSLQRTSSGLSYLVAGTGINIDSGSNGQITIINTSSPSAAPADATYLVLSSTSSLSNERVFSVSGSSLSLTDNGPGSTCVLDLISTGTANTYGAIQVNNKGQVTSGSTSWFGQNFWFSSGSSAVPFHNRTTTYRTALDLTASSLTAGIYRLGWSYVYRCNSTAASFRCRTFIINSASYDTVEEASDASSNERYQRAGFAYCRITGSVALFSLDISLETAATNTTASLYDRALELWRVS